MLSRARHIAARYGRQFFVGVAVLCSLAAPSVGTEVAFALTATPTATPVGTSTPTATAVATNTAVATVVPLSGAIPNQVTTSNGNLYENNGKIADNNNRPLVSSNADLNLLNGLSGAGFVFRVTVKVPLAAAAPVAAAQAAWQNPLPTRVIISRAIADVTTACTTGSSTLNIGTTTASPTTMSNNLLDSASCTSIATLDNISNAGTGGKSVQSLASGGWVTYAPNNGDTTALVGNLYITYNTP